MFLGECMCVCVGVRACYCYPCFPFSIFIVRESRDANRVVNILHYTLLGEYDTI